jgi:hypothetical protein
MRAAQINVCFGPEADTFVGLLDQLVGACEQWQGYRQAERLGSRQHPLFLLRFYAATGSRVCGVGLTLELPSVKENSISGRRPLTISARARPEPQECVHPSVPCPVFK